MIYKKVSVQERLPNEDGKYFVWVDNPNARSQQFPDEYNMDKKNFSVINNNFESFYDVTHWLEVDFNIEILLEDILFLISQLDIPVNLTETYGNLVMNAESIIKK